jgi:hypothetical protein
MYLPRQSAPIRRSLAATPPGDHGDRTERDSGLVAGSGPGVVPSSLVDAFMHAIRGPAKDGCEGPILVTPGV